MKTEQRAIKKHLFICCNKKEEKECCKDKNSEVLFRKLFNRLREEDLWDNYKVTKAGCLGPCGEGIAATLYPDNLLLTELTVDDDEMLYQLLMK